MENKKNPVLFRMPQDAFSEANNRAWYSRLLILSEAEVLDLTVIQKRPDIKYLAFFNGNLSNYIALKVVG